MKIMGSNMIRVDVEIGVLVGGKTLGGEGDPYWYFDRDVIEAEAEILKGVEL